MRCNVIWYDMVWCDVMRCNVIWCVAMRYDMLWCDVMWCDAEWCDMIWCDVAWCAVMWCDVMWCDALQRDMICYDTVRCDTIWDSVIIAYLIPFVRNKAHLSLHFKAAGQLSACSKMLATFVPAESENSAKAQAHIREIIWTWSLMAGQAWRAMCLSL